MPDRKPKPASHAYAACSVPIAPVRREPSHRAEQITQLLFGERVTLLETHPASGWAQIRCDWDGYEGWCKTGQLQPVSFRDFKKAPRVLVMAEPAALQMAQGQLTLPRGSELTNIKAGLVPVGGSGWKFKGKKVSLADIQLSPATLIDHACTYLHAPYLWGGRTGAGIDCSGLIQMAFKLCGVPVLRDAAQQATMGEEVHFLAQACPGDVAFFDNEEGRIVHVGLLADRHTIIHATDTSGCVVADRMDSAGIISISLKRRTHKLRTIRRIGWETPC